MTSIRRFALAVLVTGCVTPLTACTLVDTVIWGSDGAQVIETTEDLIRDLASDEASDLICDDAEADLGTAEDWKGRTAGEPEQYVAEHWHAQAPLDPHWIINLEGRPEGSKPGDTFPGDIFYRETDDGLCVIDVAWATLVAVG